MSTKFLIIFYIIISIFDFIGTAMLIDKYDCNIENNSIACNIIEQYGIIGMAAYKCSFIIFNLAVIYILSNTSRGKKYIKPLLLFASILTTFVVGYTYWIYFVVPKVSGCGT